MFVLKKTALAALFSVTISTLILGSSCVWAQDAGNTVAAENPDPNKNNVLQNLIDPGTKIYFLGNRSGLDGWLLYKDDQIQVAYTTPDKKQIIIGAMFGLDGYNITSDQVDVLSKSNHEVSTFMADIFKKEHNLNSAGQPMGVDLGSAAKANTTLESLLPPSERLLNELQGAAGVGIGDPKAPVLYMIMDPNCPHCQATWKVLRDSVMKNNLRIHLVPIGRNDEDERAAAQLLRATDPLTAWDKYVDGDKSQLAGEADPNLVKKIQANHVIVDKWSITETPYMLYRSKSGKIKVLEGEPKDGANLASDIGP